MSAYAQDGVNVEAGDDLSAFAAKICKATFGNSPYVKVRDRSDGRFRGVRTFSLVGLPEECEQTVSADGIGTKVVLSDAAGSHRVSGHDLLAMALGDLTREGSLGLVYTNILDVSNVGEPEEAANDAIRRLFLGLRNAADQGGIVLLKGEIAELGSLVGSENPDATLKYNWSGVLYGVAHPEKIITGDELAPGQILVALQEDGFRSNGISAVRAAFRMRYGDEWWADPAARFAISEAARPSVLYDRFLTRMHGWHDPSFFRPIIPLAGIAHITGGGIPSKLGEDLLFPRGLSAELYDLYDPPIVMRWCAEWRGMADEECYRTWNGGQGMIVAMDTRAYPRFEAEALRAGIHSRKCGIITRNVRPALSIRSKFSSARIEFYPK